MIRNKSGFSTPTILLLIAFFAAFVVFYGMRWGPWAYNDSAAYLSAARNLSSGKGPVILHSSGKISPVLEFPPLYPFLLSILGINTLNPNSVIQVLNSFLFACTILLFSRILFLSTGSGITAILASAFFASTQLMLSTFTSAMSEPLFIFLLVSALAAFTDFIKSRKNFSFTVLCVTSALLPLARIAGILFVGGFGFLLFLFSPQKNILSRINKALIYFFFAFIPSLLWFVVRFMTYGKVGGKRFELRFLTVKTFLRSVRKIIEVLKGWIPYWDIYIQSNFKNIAILAVLIFSISIFATIVFRFYSTALEKKFSYILIFTNLSLIIGYLLFIAVTHVISIPQIDVIDRMLAPILPLGVMLIALVLYNFWMALSKNNFLSLIILGGSLFLLRYNFLVGRSFIEEMHSNGLGFNSRQLQESGIIPEILTISDDYIMASNSAGFVLFHANKYPFQIDQFPNHTFGIGNSYGETEFREKNGRLIILFSDFNNYYGKKAPELLDTITKSLTIEYKDNEGAIYSYP